jgi:hypothetical protein
MMVHRDLAPDQPVNLKSTGTDCVEDLWSSIGGLRGNKRVYTFLTALYAVGTRNQVLALAAGGGYVIPKRNRRLKDVGWDRPAPGAVKASALVSPTLNNPRMEEHWSAGDAEARAELMLLGMQWPQNSDTQRHKRDHPEEYDDFRAPDADDEGEDAQADDEGDDDDDDDDDDEEGEGGEGDDEDDEDDDQGDAGSDDDGGGGEEESDADEDVPLSELARTLARCDKGVETHVDVPGSKDVRIHKATLLTHLTEGKKISTAARRCSYRLRVTTNVRRIWRLTW